MIKRKAGQELSAKTNDILTMEKKPIKLGAEWLSVSPCKNETCSFFGKDVCPTNCKPEIEPEEGQV